MLRVILSIVLLTGVVRAESSWVTPVSQATRDSVVRIECGNATGAGFVFHTTRHVATAFHVIATGRPISIRFSDGTSRPAKVKAIDRANDLAILELGGADIKQQPLALDPDATTIGAPVLAIGHPYATVLPVSGSKEHAAWKGLLEWTVTTGVISAVSPTRLQTDTAVNPGNSGGPLIGSDGRVVGVVSAGVRDGEGLNFAIRSDRLVELTGKLGASSTFRGDWDADLLVSLISHVDGRGATLGNFPSLGLGMEFVGRDRFTIMLGGGTLNSDESLAGGLFARETRRIFFDATVGYRKLLIYRKRTRSAFLGFAVGGMLSRDKVTERRLEVGLTDPMCDPATASCGVEAAGVESTSTRWNLRPMATTWLEFGHLRIGYNIAIDPSDARDRTQSFSIGLRL